MDLAPLPSIGIASYAGGGMAPSQPATPSGTFARILSQSLGQVGQQQHQADHAVRALAAGSTDSVHDVVLEVSKADLAFRLFLEIRNRLSDAYQEVMKMSV